MGIFDKLIGGGVITAVEGVANVVDKFIETPDEKRAFDQIKAKMAQQPQLAQIELNKVEASHRTMFVAGWRPAIGWICATGLSFIFLVNPVIQWTTGDPGPELPTDITFELILGMLGLGGLRTFEKYTGKAK
jgi:hypothetical protein